MNKAQLKNLIGHNVAVIPGTMYEGATAVPARIVEIGAEVKTAVHSGRYGMSVHTTRTNDGVRVVMLDAKTLEPRLAEDGTEVVKVLKSRQVTHTWAGYLAQQKAVNDRRKAVAKASDDAAAMVTTWAAKLGIPEYDLPSLSAGGAHWDAAQLAYNRKKLAAALQAAFELGQNTPR